MSRRSTAPHGEDGSTSSQAGSHAKISASPERVQDSTASAAASGSKCSESFARFDPATSTWRTSQRSLVAGWIEYSARWPKQGGMRSGCAYPRPPLAPRIDATDGGVSPAGFPPPRASKTTDEDEQSWRARHEQGKVATPPLSLAVRMIPTPTAGDAKSSGLRNTATSSANPGVSLTDYVRGDGGTGRTWPTPTADDANNVTRRSGKIASLTRSVQQTQLPTPSTNHRPCEGTVRLARKAWQSGSVSLEEANAIAGRDVRDAQGTLPAMLPTPTTQDAHNNGAPSQLERNAPPLNAVVGGKLNADWVELLMGWPAGWTSLPPDSGTETGKRSRASRKGKPTA